MKMEIPMLPLPFKSVRSIVHGFYPISAIIIKFYPRLELELMESDIQLSAKDYVGGALLAFLSYFVSVAAILGIVAQRNNTISNIDSRLTIIFFGLTIGFAVFAYIMIVPTWITGKKKGEIEKNLLFVVRHLMIQTSAGVPLFDSIVSVSEVYNDKRLNYGEVSKEFKKIVKDVRGGKEFASALEESALRTPSQYYKIVLRQLANANKAGANMRTVLRDVVEFLSNEQRVLIRSYGSQLNPLAMFYMFSCVIAPTMGLIFLSIFSSIAAIPVNEFTFIVILSCLIVAQVVFIGLIKSRRPTVAF